MCPRSREPQSLKALLANWPADRAIIVLRRGRRCAATRDRHLRGSAETVLAAILTGPEGGFDPEERETIRAVPNVLPVSLGSRILRADTAALAALAVWQAVRGDWG